MTPSILFGLFWVACGVLSYRIFMAIQVGNTLSLTGIVDDSTEKLWVTEWADGDSNLSVKNHNRISLLFSALGPIGLIAVLCTWLVFRETTDFHWRKTLERYRKEARKEGGAE